MTQLFFSFYEQSKQKIEGEVQKHQIKIEVSKMVFLNSVIKYYVVCFYKSVVIFEVTSDHILVL